VPARLPRRSLSGSPLCHLCWRQAPRRLVPVTGMVQVITRPLRLAKAGLMAPTARPDRRHLTDQTVSKTRRPIRTCLPTRKRRTPWRPDTTSARDPKETDHCCPGAPTLLAVGWEVLPNGYRPTFPTRWASVIPAAFILRRIADLPGQLVRAECAGTVRYARTSRRSPMLAGLNSRAGFSVRSHSDDHWSNSLAWYDRWPLSAMPVVRRTILPAR